MGHGWSLVGKIPHASGQQCPCIPTTEATSPGAQVCEGSRIPCVLWLLWERPSYVSYLGGEVGRGCPSMGETWLWKGGMLPPLWWEEKKMREVGHVKSSYLLVIYILSKQGGNCCLRDEGESDLEVWGAWTRFEKMRMRWSEKLVGFLGNGAFAWETRDLEFIEGQIFLVIWFYSAIFICLCSGMGKSKS